MIPLEEFSQHLKTISKKQWKNLFDYIPIIESLHTCSYSGGGEEFLETGKISTALVSDAQNYTVLQNKFGKTFLPIDSLKTLENIQYMKEGERGMLLCIRGGWDSNHVINIIVKEGKLLFKDAQVHSLLGSNKIFLSNNYKEFKFFKTKLIK